MKEWTIEIYLLDEAGNEKPAKCFTKVVYNLHPSFDNPVQSELLPLHIAARGHWRGRTRGGSAIQLTRGGVQPSMSRRSNAPTRVGVSSR